jgi:hypothetical protein
MKTAPLFLVTGLVLVPGVWLLFMLSRDERKPPPPPVAVEAPAVSAQISAARTVLSAESSAAAIASVAPPEPTPEPALSLTTAGRQISLAQSLQNSNPKRSRELLSKALLFEPKNERALRMLATDLLIDENLAGAQWLSELCRQINPTNYVCNRVASEAPKRTPGLETLIAIMEKCVQADAKNVTCLYNLFSASLLRTDRQEATRLAERIAKAAPGSGWSHLARGRLEAADGAYRQARISFELACDSALESACFRAEVLRGQGF